VAEPSLFCHKSSFQTSCRRDSDRSTSESCKSISTRLIFSHLTVVHRQGAWALGTVLGPTVGGALAGNDRWRWIFYMMLPFCGFGLVCVPWLVRLKRPDATLHEMLRKIDWLGGFIFICSSTSFLIAVCWGGTTYAWDHWRTLVPLIVGGVGLIATAFYERLVAGGNAFLRHSLFYVYSAHIVYFATFVHGLTVSTASCA
jgi:MFS family permease